MSLLKSNDTIINLILLDEDPIFSLGLKEICKNPDFSDINIIATGKVKDLYSFLKQYQVDLWVISLDFDRFNSQAKKVIAAIPSLIKKYPDLKIAIIVNPQELVNNFVQVSGIKGCCYKYTDIDELITTLRTCARGENYFSSKYTSSSRHQKINAWFYHQCRLGLQKINQEIVELNHYTKNKKLSVIDLIYWQGRKRELRVTKWLIKRALPQNYVNLSDFSSSTISLEKAIAENNQTKDDRRNGQIVPSNTISNIYDFTCAKINNSLRNLTGKLQEIDILKLEQRRKLFLIIVTQWQELINNLRLLKLNQSQLQEKISYPVFLEQLNQNIVNALIGDLIEGHIVKTSEIEISSNSQINLINYKLSNLYFAEQLIFYQVLEQDLFIDNQCYSYGTDTAEEIEVSVLENVIISIANYVMQYILNAYSDNVKIKDYLLQPELKSSRKVAMFRNNLGWKYRREKYWLNPKNIFEDKYEMLTFTYQGIEITKITHSRHLELNKMQGIPWLVTILIELRDSLSRGVKAIGDSLGQVIVYLLTEVIGKGIGLIGKGILQAIGSRIKN